METPTPAELAKLHAFVNTFDLETNIDTVADEAALKRWLIDQGLLARSAKVTGADVRKAHELREAVRTVLMANDGHPVAPKAVATLNRRLESLPLHIHFNTDAQPEVASVASGVDGALAQLVAGIPAAVASGSWSRLKVCANDTCQWAFYDHSKNRSGRWCSMRVCGNRVKTRTYRARTSG